jgi:hypothetical protein
MINDRFFVFLVNVNSIPFPVPIKKHSLLRCLNSVVLHIKLKTNTGNFFTPTSPLGRADASLIFFGRLKIVNLNLAPILQSDYCKISRRRQIYGSLLAKFVK